eukprot:g8948.t1
MASENELERLLERIQDTTHLERSKAHDKIKFMLQQCSLTEQQQEKLRCGVMEIVQQDNTACKMGGLATAVLLIPSTESHSEFLDCVLEICRENLEHKEPRVRHFVGDCIGALAQKQGVCIYTALEHVLISSIRRNFERDEESTDLQQESSTDDPMELLLQSSYRVVKPGTGEMRHGTEGWKSLETSFRALLKLIQGTGTDVSSFVTEEIWQLVFQGFDHPNRFVREIAYCTLGALVEMSPANQQQQQQSLADCLLVQIAKKLARGLADDWSQVRYSASIATRSFMLKGDRSNLYPLILPQMCLNRYYVAEGVKLYSQETWKLLVGDQGRNLVAQFAPEFVDYYIRQCGANNHAVREAACGCIAELMTKISKPSIEPHIRRLITALVNCFKDASWPVRDAACVACGKCVMSFPEQTRTALDELYTLWIAHLADNIASVRENSAIALGNAIRAYQDEALDVILPELTAMITEAKNQEPDSTSFSGLNNVTQFGVASSKEDDPNHTDQTMFSCGSLAPKLARGGGCMDHGFKRPKEPWEVSDGAVYLLREISAISPDRILEFIPSMTELVYLCEFSHASHLHETVWKVLPIIAKNIGKRHFKRYLSEMLDALFRSLRSDHQLEVVAATQFISFCSEFLGRAIFRGRLSDDQAQIFDTIVVSQGH